METAPIVLFCFNRPEHLKKTIEALQQNLLAAQSDLYIYADGARHERDEAKVNAVRQYIRTITGFKKIEIIERTQNWGLAESVIAGVTEIVAKYGRVIVMEDDLVCTNDYLDFMNQALNKYKQESTIFSVSGYLFPIDVPKNYQPELCLLPRASSWGWGTWYDRWQKADFNVSDFEQFMQDETAKKDFMKGGEDLLPMLVKQRLGMIDSWAVRWCYTHFKNQAYCLYPIRSKIQSTGIDGAGTNVRYTHRFKTIISDKMPVMAEIEQLKANEYLQKSLQKFFQLTPQRRLINYFKVFRRWQKST
ncbi:MAG: glycosyltransferase [Spirosomataceae bacterium]